MGKIRRYKKKLHSTAKHEIKPTDSSIDNKNYNLPIALPSNDLFKNIDINFDSLKQELLSDDLVSVKSFKSIKFGTGSNKALSKKEKLAVRRGLLLRKIDTVNQLKKEKQIKEKRKNTAVIGDMKPLHDALPSLETLLKNKDKYSNMPYKNSKNSKSKGIEKGKKRKRNMIQSMGVYKQILNNKLFLKNPLNAVSEHIKHIIDQDQKSSKK